MIEVGDYVRYCDTNLGYYGTVIRITDRGQAYVKIDPAASDMKNHTDPDYHTQGGEAHINSWVLLRRAIDTKEIADYYDAVSEGI